MTSVPQPSSASGLAPTPWLPLVVTILLVLLRTVPYAWWGTLAFDADQAVVGLMAKHIAEFRAFPVYQYALSYVLMVSAYVIAPFMWVLGPTVLALKLPLVLMNVGVGVLLLMAIVRAGVRPWAALLLTLPVAMTSPVSNAGLMDALGMTVEPALFVLALWYSRRMPIVLGVVAALGFQVREFMAYGIAALLAVEVFSGAALRPDGRRRWLVATVSGLGTAALIGGVARFASIRGPDTWIDASVDSNLATLGGAFCFMPAQAARNVVDLGASYLGKLVGPVPAPLAEAAVQSRLAQGLAGAWPVIAAVFALALARCAWLWRGVWQRRTTPAVQLAVFLSLVGLQSVVVYAISRCGPLSLLTIRYALLGVLLPSGVALLAWTIEPHRRLRHVLAGALIALAAINTWPHLRLWQEQLTHPIISNRAQLGPALEARGIRYARSDYWTAYYVNFLTQERVVIVPDVLSRVEIYERALAEHAAEAVRVRTEPCGASSPIVAGYYVCPESAP